ncbi:MAG: macro domain-containing protein, partial [Thermoguttaceae bacterium]|nr:macro domain-containing protein [Thermoguttaceae bacterium]
GAIHRRGGPSIMAETAANYPNGCPTGSAVPTGAGRLNAKFVFHAVAPIYSPGRTDCPEQLRSAYYRCLSLAIEKKCRSVAFPSLGTGAYHYPLTEAATIAISTVRQFLDTLPDRNSLEKIIFVLFDSQTCQVFERTLSEILPES